jgi:hypothetical protein
MKPDSGGNPTGVRTPPVPDEVVQIAKYTYYCLSSRDEDDVAMYLYDAADDVVGRVRVVPDDRPLPPAERHAGLHTLYYRRAAFHELVDMLRNEGPVYLTWRDESNAALGTGFEPVGDGELRR